MTTIIPANPATIVAALRSIRAGDLPTTAVTVNGVRLLDRVEVVSKPHTTLFYHLSETTRSILRNDLPWGRTP